MTTKPSFKDTIKRQPERPPVDPASLAAFAEGAANPHGATPRSLTQTAPPTPTAPSWAHLDNTRRTPAFTMRFTAKELAKLKHISETTPPSMHEFCLKAIQAALDAALPDTK